VPGPFPEPPAVRPITPVAILLVPATQRYEIHRRLRVEEELAGQPTTLLSYRIFVTSTIAEPGDSTGYPVTHVVDSIVPDTGSYVPPTVNFAAARGMRFTWRLTPTGAARDVAPPDSVAAQQFSDFLGNVRDFYPRLQASGLLPGAEWTDTLTTADRAGGGEVQMSLIQHAAVTGWETRHGAQGLRIEVGGTFTVQSVFERGGQTYDLTGSGSRVGAQFVSGDGRYLGGETRDSMSLAVSLPAQGLTVPIRQMVHSVVTVLP
jgi:hypothetical protein